MTCFHTRDQFRVSDLTILTTASPHLDILLPGTTNVILRLHPVFSQLGGGCCRKVVSWSSGRRGLLTRGVPIGHDGREGWVLL